VAFLKQVTTACVDNGYVIVGILLQVTDLKDKALGIKQLV